MFINLENVRERGGRGKVAEMWIRLAGYFRGWIDGSKPQSLLPLDGALQQPLGA